MIKKNCMLLLAAFTFIQLLPAQPLPSTLLWKITGNGLQKPFYLFGTMHLTDERIFDLGDSLYKAIEHSDGFAIEIDPESFTPLLIDETKKSYLNAMYLKNMMQGDKFRKYGNLLAKKLHKNEEDITTADVLRERNKWIQDSYSTGKMQTFLDIYLFDIARREGKWTGGVEDMKDQQGLDDLVDESDIKELAMDEDEQDTKRKVNSYEEYFINAYVRNDLKTIDSLSGLGDSLYEDALLVKRNKKMAMRMDSLGHVRSMVFAVGAAHLPGNKGLIALLKAKGFTVTPIFSSKKIKPADYKVTAVALQWYDVTDAGGLYTASMPGNPGDMTMYGVINMKIYFDIFSSTIYMSTALQTPYSETMADSIFGKVASYYFGTSDYKTGTPITLNKIPGREFTSKKGNYSHGYLLFKDGEMYMAIAMSMKQDSSAATDINRFLHSFVIADRMPADGKIIVYSDKIKAYRLELPASPKSANELVNARDTTMITDLNIVSDPLSGAYLFFGTNESGPGYYIENDSVTLRQIEKTQRAKFKNLGNDTMYVKNGTRMMDFSGMMAQIPLMMQVHYQFRGNRWYALVAMFDTSKDITPVKRFFKSFAIMDYGPGEWQSYTSGDSLFSTWAPLKFSLRVKEPTFGEGDSIYHYTTYDSSRGDSYTVESEGFSKYYWQKNDSTLWASLAKVYETTDSMLLKKAVSNGASNGYELEKQQKGSDNIKRVRLLLNGGKLYTLITIQGAAEINNTNNNMFFDSFRFNKIWPNTNLLISKAALLLNDIGSDDSATAAHALDYLSQAPFTINELPLIHKALLKHYAVNKYDFDQTKYKLKQIIIDLKDSSSLSFAKNNYLSADDTTKNELLTIIASFKTSENFDDLKNILANKTPHIKPGYDFTNELIDSLPLTAAILPGLLPLLKDTVMAPAIIAISRKLLDSEMIDKNLLQPYQSYILNLSRESYAALKVEPDNYQNVDYDLENILGRLNNTEANAMLQKLSVLPMEYLQLYAVNYLLQNRQAINPLAIQALAKSKSTRINLYDTLKAYKKQQLFPSRYLTQKYLAESLVYGSNYDDDDPTSVTYLADKVINFKGRQSRLYFFKLAFGDSDDVRYSLGCAGPFAVSVTEMSTQNATGAIYEDEDLDSSKLPEQEDELLKQIENGFEWKDSKGKSN